MSINATLFFQIIVFFVLVWFTMKFVWPPITKALDERALKIADGLSAAERAKTELAAADQLVKKELAQASNETASRLADADRRAQAIIEEAKARATEEANKIVAAAQAEVEQQTVRAREALRGGVLRRRGQLQQPGSGRASVHPQIQRLGQRHQLAACAQRRFVDGPPAAGRLEPTYPTVG